MNNRKRHLVIPLLLIANIIYCFVGWCIFIIFEMTSPNDPKFDLNPHIRIIIFPILLLLHALGELVFLKKSCKITKRRCFYVILSLLIYFFPIWANIIEMMFF